MSKRNIVKTINLSKIESEIALLLISIAVLSVCAITLFFAAVTAQEYLEVKLQREIDPAWFAIPVGLLVAQISFPFARRGQEIRESKKNNR